MAGATLREILAGLFDGGPSSATRPVLLFVAGGPCSGKDFTIGILRRLGLLPATENVFLSGEALRKLPRYHEARSTHPEYLPCLYRKYRSLSRMAVAEAAKRRCSLICNTHFADPALVSQLTRVIHGAGGLSVALVATTPPETFHRFRRLQERNSGMDVDVTLALQLHRTLSASWPAVSRMVDAYCVLDNSCEALAALGTPAVCAEGTRSSGPHIFDQAAWSAFLAKGDAADASGPTGLPRGSRGSISATQVRTPEEEAGLAYVRRMAAGLRSDAARSLLARGLAGVS